jgi:hypothetical protein
MEKEATQKETSRILNEDIYKNIKDVLINIIFETLIVKGILSQFVPNKKLTDQIFINRDDIYKEQSLPNSILARSEQNDYYTSAYHYLTLLPYCKMKNYMTEKGEESFFSYGTKRKQSWYIAYSFDWVAQIGFCHHYIHNRIIFITGATGVGKSTEIPKLFLYYSKAIDYLQAPKVICTEPRQAPTETNAAYISKALGVPMFLYKNGQSGQAGDTDYYYIQMHHQKTQHEKRVYHSMLKYITEGSLILEINDPILKQTRGQKYGIKNRYDVIMIDEAHEHKIDMDILLTILKLPIGYNNSLKLVILSATMDDDEPRYRRFYRDVNDNRKYPTDEWIRNHKIDRINVDRRYHISPPGMGTRYNVEEIYTPDKTDIETVINIIRTTTDGDILLFKSGVPEINKALQILNSELPSDVIALPYHSRFGDQYASNKNFIENLTSESILKLRISKTDDFTTTKNLYQGTGNYRRAVIIATNAAEASITIQTLKFVIETGDQKVNLYDYKKRGEKLVKGPISESSRIQRKGRVGRTSSGTVYYLYEKGTMENNKISYEMSTNNLYLNIFKKLKMSSSESILIEHIYDPNCYKTQLSHKQLKSIFGKSGLDKMIMMQYFNGKTYYEYYGNDDMYDYNNYKKFANYYETGFDTISLTDNIGSFYLIHPNELQIKRNINGDITGITDDDELQFIPNDMFNKTGHILSKKVRSFWQILLDYLYVDFSSKTTPENKKEMLDIIKTTLGEKFIELSEEFKISNHNIFRTLMFGIALGCGNDIIKLCSIYPIINYDMSKIAKMTPKTINVRGIQKTIIEQDIKKIVTLTSNDIISSDNNTLLNILNELDNFMKKSEIPTKLNSRECIKDLSTKYDYTSEDYQYLLGPVDKYSEQLKNKIITSNIGKTVNDISQQSLEKCGQIIDAKSENIIQWCKDRNIEYTIIRTYLREYINLRSLITRLMSDDLIFFLKKLKKNLTLKKLNTIFKSSNLFLERNIEPIDLALLFGHPLNICRKIDSSNNYISIYTMSLDDTYKIKTIGDPRYNSVSNTFLSDRYLQKYLLFLNTDIETNTISCLHYVTPKIITILGNIYSKEHFNRMVENNSVNKFIEREGMVNIIRDSTNISNTITQFAYIVNVIKGECIIHVDENILYFISLLKN